MVPLPPGWFRFWFSLAGDVGVTLLHVQLQAVPDDEAARAHPAGVGPLARMDAAVGLEVGRLGELLPTLLTAEGPLARVEAHVDLQVLGGCVGPVADGAEEALHAPASGRRWGRSQHVPGGMEAGPVRRLVLEPEATALRQLGVRGPGPGQADQLDGQAVRVGALGGQEVGQGQLTFGLFVPHGAEVQFWPVWVGLHQRTIAEVGGLLRGAGDLLGVQLDRLKV